MKQLLPFISLIVVTLAGYAQKVTASPENLKKLDWLEGTWVRQDMKPNRSGTERWMKFLPMNGRAGEFP